MGWTQQERLQGRVGIEAQNVGARGGLGVGETTRARRPWAVSRLLTARGDRWQTGLEHRLLSPELVLESIRETTITALDSTALYSLPSGFILRGRKAAQVSHWSHLLSEQPGSMEGMGGLDAALLLAVCPNFCA